MRYFKKMGWVKYNNRWDKKEVIIDLGIMAVVSCIVGVMVWYML